MQQGSAGATPDLSQTPASLKKQQSGGFGAPSAPHNEQQISRSASSLSRSATSDPGDVKKNGSHTIPTSLSTTPAPGTVPVMGVTKSLSSLTDAASEMLEAANMELPKRPAARGMAKTLYRAASQVKEADEDSEENIAKDKQENNELIQQFLSLAHSRGQAIANLMRLVRFGGELMEDELNEQESQAEYNAADDAAVSGTGDTEKSVGSKVQGVLRSPKRVVRRSPFMSSSQTQADDSEVQATELAFLLDLAGDGTLSVEQILQIVSLVDKKLESALQTLDSEDSRIDLLKSKAASILRFDSVRKNNAVGSILSLIQKADEFAHPELRTSSEMQEALKTGNLTDAVHAIVQSGMVPGRGLRFKIFDFINIRNVNLSTPANSLKWTLKVLNEIYDAKSEADAACERLNIPRRSMPQYIYSIFTRKHGVGPVADGKIWELLVSLNAHRPARTDVDLFATFVEETRSLDELSFYLHCRRLLKSNLAHEFGKSGIKGYGFEYTTKDIADHLMGLIFAEDQNDYQELVLTRLRAVDSAILTAPFKPASYTFVTTLTLYNMNELLEAILDTFRGNSWLICLSALVTMFSDAEKDRKHINILLQAFNIVDSNQDGWIDRSEFARIMVRTYPKRTVDEVDALFSRLCTEAGFELMSNRMFVSAMLQLIKKNLLTLNGHIMRSTQRTATEQETEVVDLVVAYWASFKTTAASYITYFDAVTDDEDVEAAKTLRKILTHLDSSLTTASTPASDLYHNLRKFAYVALAHQV